MRKLSRFENIEEAAKHMSDLNILYGVVALLEGGTITRSDRTAQRIIQICRDEGQRRLRDYDKYVAAANRGTP